MADVHGINITFWGVIKGVGFGIAYLRKEGNARA